MNVNRFSDLAAAEVGVNECEPLAKTKKGRNG